MASIISAGTTSGTALNMAGDTSGVLQLATNGSTTALTINTSQNVGIGESSPDTKVHIYGASTAGRGQLYIQGSSTISRFTLANSSDAYALNTYGDSSTSLLTWDTNSGYSFRWTISDAERMRITSIGNVGIGTSSPTGALSITTGQNASIVTTGPGAHGRMIGKFFSNGGSAETFNLLTIDSFNTANTRVFVNVTIRWVNAIGDQGGTATAWAGASQGGTRTQGAFVASEVWGTSVLPSLSWSGNTLRITTPSLSFIGGFIDVEYVSFDGAQVTLDPSNQ
jgi:hypothetical protein